MLLLLRGLPSLGLLPEHPAVLLLLLLRCCLAGLLLLLLMSSSGVLPCTSSGLLDGQAYSQGGAIQILLGIKAFDCSCFKSMQWIKQYEDHSEILFSSCSC